VPTQTGGYPARQAAVRLRAGVTIALIGLLTSGCLGGPTTTPASSAMPAASTEATAVPTAAPAASPSPSPTLSPGDAPTAWYPVDVEPLPDVAGDAQMAAVTQTWFGYLAVGNTPRGGTSWWSTNGTSWTPALFAEPSMAYAQLTGVAVLGHRLVAVGGFPEGSQLPPGPAIWTSTDGVAWTPVVLDSAGASGLITDIAVVDGGLSAVGAGEEWTSTDGLTWTGNQFDGSRLVSGPLGALAWGSSGSGGWQPTVWRLDGVEPGAAPTPITTPAAFSDVVEDADGFIGFAADRNATLAGRTVYRSTDGSSWQPVGTTAAAGGDIVAGASVAGFGVVAATAPSAAGVEMGLFRSADLADWTPVMWPTPADPQASITALSALGSSIVAVGSIAGRRPAAWLAQPAATDVPLPPEPVAQWTSCPPLADLSTPSTALRVLVSFRTAPSGVATSSSLPARCFGSRSIRLTGYLAQPEGLGGQCFDRIRPTWLTGGCNVFPAGWLEPVASLFGTADFLMLFARPGIAGAIKGGHWVELTGHYDDSASTTCRDVDMDGRLQPVARTVAMCRSHFVVTAIRSIADPTPATNPDPATNLGLSDAFVLAPFDTGWDNLTLPSGTTWGFREVTPPGGVPVLVTVFEAAGPDAGPVETALLEGTPTPSSTTVDGVAVRMSADGTEAVFTIRRRVFDVSGSAPSDANSVDQVVRAVIQGLG